MAPVPAPAPALVLVPALIPALLALAAGSPAGPGLQGPELGRPAPSGRTPLDALPPQPWIHVERDLAYRALPDVDPQLLSLDVYRRPRRSGAPIVVYVHGGGWRQGHKSRVALKPEACVDRGYVFVSTNYRLSPEAAFPAHAEDVAAAVAWVREHALELGGDPQRIALMGHSAGAHLVALVATDPRYLAAHGLAPADVRAVVPIDTQAYNMLLLADLSGGTLGEIYTFTFGDDPAGWAFASPITYVGPGNGIPPMLVAYSDGFGGSGLQRAVMAQNFAVTLVAAGVEARTVRGTGQDHQQINRQFGLPGDRVTEEAFAFLRRHLR